MSKLKLPIIIVLVLAALGGGLFVSGMGPFAKSGPAKKYAVPPITMTEPFTINLNDADSASLVLLNVAIKLDSMDEAHWTAFSGGGGKKEGAAGAMSPGAAMVADYPPFRDAVIEVTSGFNAKDLQTDAGKTKLKQALLDRFHQIAEVDAAEAKTDANAADPAHVGPPFHVLDVDFTKFIVDVRAPLA
jgi:flagellar basal body-associated protein FliL